MLNRKKEAPIEHIELSGIMRTADGRNVIRRLLVNCGYFGSTYAADARQHAYNEGRRSVAVSLVNELQEAAPNELQQLLREYFNG